MVSDLTTNVMLLGVKYEATLNFRADFSGKYFNIKQQIEKMEQLDFQLGKIIQRENVEFSRLVNKEEIMRIRR